MGFSLWAVRGDTTLLSVGFWCADGSWPQVWFCSGVDQRPHVGDGSIFSFLQRTPGMHFFGFLWFKECGQSPDASWFLISFKVFHAFLGASCCTSRWYRKPPHALLLPVRSAGGLTGTESITKGHWRFKESEPEGKNSSIAIKAFQGIVLEGLFKGKMGFLKSSVQIIRPFSTINTSASKIPVLLKISCSYLSIGMVFSFHTWNNF